MYLDIEIIRMESSVKDRLMTMLAPVSWGTTYVVTATLLPPDRPLLAALLRALPAGLLVLLFVRRLPPSPVWWWRFLVLGVVNFAAFFPLLFYAAYRLPGGVAATLGTVQPLMVAGLAWLALRTRTPLPQLLAALAGVAGVALMTLTAQARLDPLAVVAMLVGVGLMALGIVLVKKWGSPGHPLMSTAWQMTLGGLVLVPVTLLGEGLPAAVSVANAAGYTYLATFGGALAYILWFRGIGRLSPATVSLLTLSNPLTATLAGLVVLGQTLTSPQIAGLAVALAALVAGQALSRPRPAPRATERRRELVES
ncbi:EamA family transporter [Pseudonocardia sp. DSM 110487]|nr:EamA family transporter [Pseudonocardia sp. DSM 110487]